MHKIGGRKSILGGACTTMVMPMYRRSGSMRMRRRNAKQYKKIMHLSSTIGNAMTALGSLTFFAANAGAYVTTATVLTAAREAISNREQENTIGSKIFGITFDIIIQPAADLVGGALEYVVFKIERAFATPVSGTGLPTDANILTLGLQAAFRQIQPGRVIKYGAIPYTEQTTAVRTIRGSYGKFKLSTIRTGDFYGIMLFNRAANTPIVSIQSRYKECI